MVSSMVLDPRGKVLEATNLHTSPHPGQDATGYSVLSSGSGNTFTPSAASTGGLNGLGYWRVTASGANGSNGVARLGNNQVNGPGTVVTIGMWVRSSAVCDIRCVIREFTNGDGTGTETTTAANSVTVAANVWTFFTMTLALAGTTNSWRPEFRWPAGSTAAGRTFDFDQLSIALGATAADFTGSTADTAGVYYSWTDTEFESTSEKYLDDPDTSSAAIFALGIKLEWEQRTIVHDVPGAATPPVSVLPAGPRSGRIRYLFSERETARRAEIIHTRPGVITLTDADWPGGGMNYVAQGDLTSELDPDTRIRWVLETGFAEV